MASWCGCCLLHDDNGKYRVCVSNTTAVVFLALPVKQWPCLFMWHKVVQTMAATRVSASDARRPPTLLLSRALTLYDFYNSTDTPCFPSIRLLLTTWIKNVPKMASNDLQSKNYRTETPTKIWLYILEAIWRTFEVIFGHFLVRLWRVSRRYVMDTQILSMKTQWVA